MLKKPTLTLSQNENKTLQDNLKHNSSAYDEKHAALLAKLEGIQEEKDHPRKQVVDMSVDTLYVFSHSLFRWLPWFELTLAKVPEPL